MTTPAPLPFRQTSSMAIISLVFGLLGWSLLPLVGSIVAIVTGHLARGEIRRAPERYEGDGLAVAGLVLGYAAIGLALLALLIAVLFFGGLFAMIAATS
ncbi:DUF4190 domain-containing protein [Luteimonas deserti]|nr:DUF4190 domain-containing protein [Luteimonas deserti]